MIISAITRRPSASGVAFNLANLLIVGFLVFRLTGRRRTALWPAIG